MNPETEAQPRRRNRANRNISDAEMKKFMAWLAPTEEEAGRKYQEIHRCLTAIFVRRGYSDAEDLADEAIDRVIRRIARDDSFEGTERIPYFVRVAYYLHLERQSKKRPPPPPPLTDTAEEREQADRCLELCLNHLEPRERELLLQYYRDDKRARIDGHKRLAEEWGLAVEALRLKVHRLKVKLRPCLKNCLAQAENH
jgi:DNA-directed RNA polymerase specialized sigma24 family protein